MKGEAVPSSGERKCPRDRRQACDSCDGQISRRDTRNGVAIASGVRLKSSRVSAAGRRQSSALRVVEGSMEMKIAGKSTDMWEG